MIVDCDTCTARGPACTDCVVTFLTVELRPRGGTGPVDLAPAEATALDVLACAGLVAPLRHVDGTAGRGATPVSAGSSAPARPTARTVRRTG